MSCCQIGLCTQVLLHRVLVDRLTNHNMDVSLSNTYIVIPLFSLSAQALMCRLVTAVDSTTPAHMNHKHLLIANPKHVHNRTPLIFPN